MVINSDFGSIAGIPLPVFGIVAFAVFLGVSLFPARSAAKYLDLMAILAGLCGLAFLLIQVLMQRFCLLCLIIDALGMLLATVALGARPLLPSSSSLWNRLAWVSVALAGVSVPEAWNMLRPPPPVPAAIKMHWSSGKITVVEITDFECVYCRRTHALLSQFVKEKGDEIKFVRLVKPLHNGVKGQLATRTYWFAAARGKADEMADALFSASDLTAEGCANLVQTMGLDLTEYRAVSGCSGRRSPRPTEQRRSWSGSRASPPSGFRIGCLLRTNERIV